MSAIAVSKSEIFIGSNAQILVYQIDDLAAYVSGPAPRHWMIPSLDLFLFAMQIHTDLLYTLSARFDTSHLIVFTLTGELCQKLKIFESHTLLSISEEHIVMMGQTSCSVYSISYKSLYLWKIPFENHLILKIAIEKEIIYATEGHQHCIYMFSIKGQPLTQLGYDPYLRPFQRMLCTPRALWVTSRFIYVGDDTGIQIIYKDGLIARLHHHRCRRCSQIVIYENSVYVLTDSGYYNSKVHCLTFGDHGKESKKDRKLVD